MSTQVEQVFRQEWGRAVAVLTRLTGDLGLAEDAVQEAFTTAVDRWPGGPLPSDPAGWLIAVAKNHAVDRIRRESRRPAWRAAPGSHGWEYGYPEGNEEWHASQG